MIRKLKLLITMFMILFSTHLLFCSQNQSIADRRTKRNCGPRSCLIEECDMIHYAFSCAEQVENIHEPATYTEAVVSGDREK